MPLSFQLLLLRFQLVTRNSQLATRNSCFTKSLLIPLERIFKVLIFFNFYNVYKVLGRVPISETTQEIWDLSYPFIAIYERNLNITMLSAARQKGACGKVLCYTWNSFQYPNIGVFVLLILFEWMPITDFYFTKFTYYIYYSNNFTAICMNMNVKGYFVNFLTILKTIEKQHF